MPAIDSESIGQSARSASPDGGDGPRDGARPVGGGLSAEMRVQRGSVSVAEQSVRYSGKGFSLRGEKNRLPYMEMNVYDLAKVLELYRRHGFTDPRLEHTDHGGIKGVVVIGRR